MIKFQKIKIHTIEEKKLILPKVYELLFAQQNSQNTCCLPGASNASSRKPGTCSVTTKSDDALL